MNHFEDAVFEAHKRAHGVTPKMAVYNLEKWDRGGEWYMDPTHFIDALWSMGYEIVVSDQ